MPSAFLIVKSESVFEALLANYLRRLKRSINVW